MQDRARDCECAVNGKGEVALFLPALSYLPLEVHAVGKQTVWLIGENGRSGYTLPKTAYRALTREGRCLVVEMGQGKVVREGHVEVFLKEYEHPLAVQAP